MLSVADQEFLHRMNRDGTFDSICPHCVRTIASHYSEALLAGVERQHKCADPELQWRFLRYTGRPHQPLFHSPDAQYEVKRNRP